jgi:hypothetical protein
MVRGAKPAQYERSVKDASGKERSVHVTAAGKILKTETESKDKD